MYPSIVRDRADQHFASLLEGTSIASDMGSGVSYRIERVIGDGGMSLAFFALRIAPDSQTPVVLKILRPQMIRSTDRAALLAVRKEAVALGRLNERLPPAPFVVRLVDTGTLHAPYGTESLAVPWLAIEYVHGGAEGTSLEERMARAVDRTGYAFDPERAAHAVECLAQGLSAIHEVGVIHRDIKPANVLCCGFGAEEIFKIADFGIARPTGMAATFGAMLVGTPGHAAPEQLLVRTVGPYSDVFSLATVVYYLLTGEDYFQFEYPSEYTAVVKGAARRRLAEAGWLHPDLRARPDACAAIDAALARATAFEEQERPSNPRLLAQMVAPSLRHGGPISRSAKRRQRSLLQDLAPQEIRVFSTRRAPDEERVVRAVAWDGDGRCLAVTSEGLAFWDGFDFRALAAPEPLSPKGIHFVLRLDAGRWLVGGDGATAALCTSAGASKLLVGPDPEVRFVLASGDVDDLAVLVGMRKDEPPTLHGLAGGRWLKPASLSRAASVTSISRLDDRRWLVTGRTLDRDGFAAIYDPLAWEVRRVKAPSCRAYLASATRSDAALGIIVGAGGNAVRFEGRRSTPSQIEGGPDLSAAAIDEAGRVWVGSAGALWVQPPGDAQWNCAHRAGWETPFISIFAHSGRVMAMSADGGILEGRPAFD
ncbi:protein kinase domain-containing protein [Polyangium jinanense]|uniref:protein kinase domain-containing protein n=1 Tax=Polyangium jinanense TaxID=2829994 RepID=UPI00234155A2|nr:serine/threonine-protein kinase [Polyangium jinanense]